MNIITLIDESPVKTIVIFPLGILITLAALVGAFHGLAIGYNGIITNQVTLVVLGVATIFAVLGIFGAWYRYYKKLSSMSLAQRKFARFFLYCGFAASIYLVAASLYAGFGWQIGLFFFLFTLGSGLFIYATPKGF